MAPPGAKQRKLLKTSTATTAPTTSTLTPPQTKTNNTHNDNDGIKVMRPELAMLSANNKKRNLIAIGGGDDVDTTAATSTPQSKHANNTSNKHSQSSRHAPPNQPIHPSELLRKTLTPLEISANANKFPNNTLFVSNLDFSHITSIHLQTLFGKYGHVLKVQTVSYSNSASGSNNGGGGGSASVGLKSYCFVEMSSNAEAYMAMFNLDGRLLSGRRIVVCKGRVKSDSNKLKTVDGEKVEEEEDERAVNIEDVENKIRRVKEALGRRKLEVTVKDSEGER